MTRTTDFETAYQTLRGAADYFRDNPKSAALRSFLRFGDRSPSKKPLYKMLLQLSLLGGDELVNALADRLDEIDADASINSEDVVKQTLDAFYNIFASLALMKNEDGELIVPNDQLKALKKNIHAYAESLGLSKKIINKQKLAEMDLVDQWLEHVDNNHDAWLKNYENNFSYLERSANVKKDELKAAKHRIAAFKENYRDYVKAKALFDAAKTKVEAWQVFEAKVKKKLGERYNQKRFPKLALHGCSKDEIKEAKNALKDLKKEKNFKKFAKARQDYESARQAMRLAAYNDIVFNETKLEKEKAIIDTKIASINANGESERAAQKAAYKPAKYLVISDLDKAKKAIDDEDRNKLKFANLKEENGVSVLDSLEKHQSRKRKKVINVVSTAIAVVVCVGEAVVPFVMAGAFNIFGLTILVGAYAVNFFLFKAGASATLSQILNGKLYRDSKGRKIPKALRIGINTTLISCVCGGGVFAFLTFGSILQSFANVSFLTALATSVPFLPWIAAGIVAFGTLAAFTTLLYTTACRLIKPEERAKIINFFKKRFVDVWKTDEHLLKKVGRFALSAVSVLFASAVSVAVFIISYAFLRSDAINVMTQTFKASMNLARSIGTAITLLGMITFSTFNLSSEVRLMNLGKTIGFVATGIVLKGLAMLGFKKSRPADPKKENSFRSRAHARTDNLIAGVKGLRGNAVRKTVAAVSMAFRGLLYIGGGLNSHGQALGPTHDPAVHHAMGASLSTGWANNLNKVIYPSFFFNSILPNLADVKSATSVVRPQQTALDKLKAPNAKAAVPVAESKGDKAVRKFSVFAPLRKQAARDERGNHYPVSARQARA